MWEVGRAGLISMCICVVKGAWGCASQCNDRVPAVAQLAIDSHQPALQASSNSELAGTGKATVGRKTKTKNFETL